MAEENQRLHRKARRAGALARVTSINTFLADVITALTGTNLLGAIENVIPWAPAVGKAVADKLPLVRFVVKVLDKFTAIDDPNELGNLACRLAYQQAVLDAVKYLADDIPTPSKRLRTTLEKTPFQEQHTFETFTYKNALSHPFFEEAQTFLQAFAYDLGLDEVAERRLRAEVQRRFVATLRMVLSRRATHEQFAPFRALINSDAGQLAAGYQALEQHNEYQQWLYEEQPIFGSEPFTLDQVYVAPECDKRTWGQICKDDDSTRESDHDSERYPLIETILAQLGQADFHDAIIVQGPAGSGKSSCTLRLTWELRKLGLVPIRLMLKDVHEDMPFMESLGQALRIDDLQRNPQANKTVGNRDLFADVDLFAESVPYDNTTICKYVLILDGWDELVVGASDDFRQGIRMTLQKIRKHVLRDPAQRVRVILTGRPSQAIEASGFLRAQTVLLTLRTMRPATLRTYCSRIKQAVRAGDDTSAWQPLLDQDLDALCERYENDYDARVPGELRRRASLDVLGSPLLGFLALRLLARCPEHQVGRLLDNPTALYRSLVDLVVSKGGKPEEAEFEPTKDHPVLYGHELRKFLRNTAEIMTVLRTESLSKKQLVAWLDYSDVDRLVDDLDANNALSRLLISFFFKGESRALGCEFMHKSFREYLMAERVVEVLKRYGKTAGDELSSRQSGQPHQGFDHADPRHKLCEQLARLLGPAPFSPEVSEHIWTLIEWELERTHNTSQVPPTGTQTQACDVHAWKRIRTGVLDIWDWWASAAHMRSSMLPRSDNAQPKNALAIEIEHEFLSRDRGSDRRPPASLLGFDAHLGEALFELAACVHAQLAIASGIVADGSKVSLSAPGTTTVERPYQTRYSAGEASWLLFWPRGRKDYFVHSCSRINARMHRARGIFPWLIRAPLVDLSSANLKRFDFTLADLRGALLTRARLAYARLASADLRGANLRHVRAQRTDFTHADLTGADLTGASLTGANLTGANLTDANLTGANLTGANLTDANLTDANLTDANLTDTKGV